MVIFNKLVDHYNKPVLLFDGVCNVCNSAVKWVINNEKHAIVRFASFQSDFYKEFCRINDLDFGNMDSVMLMQGTKIYAKSTAAIEIARLVGGFWRLAVLGYALPRPLRDAIYDFIARNRYKWFGRRDACMIPSPEIKQRFLETATDAALWRSEKL